jgi:hypothetical protein
MNAVLPDDVELSVRRVSDERFEFRYLERFPEVGAEDFRIISANTLALPKPDGWRWTRNIRARTMTLYGGGSRMQIGGALAGEFWAWSGVDKEQLLALMVLAGGGAIGADTQILDKFPGAKP